MVCIFWGGVGVLYWGGDLTDGSGGNRGCRKGALTCTAMVSKFTPRILGVLQSSQAFRVQVRCLRVLAVLEDLNPRSGYIFNASAGLCKVIGNILTLSLMGFLGAAFWRMSIQDQQFVCWHLERMAVLGRRWSGWKEREIGGIKGVGYCRVGVCCRNSIVNSNSSIQSHHHFTGIV